MSFEFKLPDIGEGIAEGEITQWHVKVGDSVKEDDPFVEVMTDKATVDIPAPRAGVIAEIRHAAGSTVPVGDVIVVIDEAAGSGAPAPAAKSAAAAAPADAAPAQPSVAAPSAPAPQPAAPVAVTASNGGNGYGAPASSRKVLAAPAVRRRAREAGIDLSAIAGSGPAGRVTRDDLDQALRSGPAPAIVEPVAERTAAPVALPPRATRPSGGEERIPLRGIRKRIAERMQQSKNTAAHFTYVDDVDVTELVSMRASMKELAAEQNVKLTYMPFLIQAITATLPRYPMLNASLDEATQELVYKHYYNIGFAADTPNGLVVPVIKDADQKSILRLAAEVQDLAGRARTGGLAVDEITGSTFTITNAGNIGGLFATPVINYPEVAIVGVHKMQDQPVVRDGEIVVRKIMYLSISLDHRVVDGADGARFMNDVIRLLEDPRRLLLGTL